MVCVLVNGGRLILEMLRLHGVRHVFGLPGETTLGLYREWSDFPDITHVLTHDERNAAFMAEAYAKATGMVGVSEAPSPGAAHPAPGVLESFKGSVPTICFTSDVPYNGDTRNMLSGFDQTALYKAITKESLIITKVRDIPHIIRRAFRISLSGRPGAVHIRVPLDVYESSDEVSDIYADACGCVWVPDRPLADLQKIEEAIELLASAVRPVIVCGQGALVSGAGQAVLDLAQLLNIPVGTTMTGKGCIPEDHPLSIRLIGARGGTSYSNRFLLDADLVFFIGSNTDSAGTDGWKMPPSCPGKAPKVIQLDISREAVGNNYHADVCLVGDAKATVEFMANRAAESGITGNAKNAKDIASAMRELDSRIANASNSEDRPIHPARFMKALEGKMPDMSMIVVEAGVGSIYSASCIIQRKMGRMLLSNYSMGALGYSVPGAIGAAVGRPDHTVFAMCGDGSFHFVAGELETVRRLGLDVKIIVFNNNAFGWIKGETEHVYRARQFATDFTQVDYVKVAEGFGIKGEMLDDPRKIEETISHALAERGPFLIQMPVLSQDKLVPPVPRWIPSAREKNLPYLY